MWAAQLCATRSARSAIRTVGRPAAPVAALVAELGALHRPNGILIASTLIGLKASVAGKIAASAYNMVA